MLKPENSRLLAQKYKIAVMNRDKKMINKITKIKYNAEITDEIKKYKKV